MSPDLVRAHQLIELGRHRDAAARLAAHLAADPADADALRLMSSACVGLGDHARAVEAARSATAAAPEDPRSHLARWWAAYSATDHADAAAAAAEAVRLDPGAPEGHRALAIALSHLPRRGREARRSAEEAVRLAPHSSDAWQSLGYALHKRRPRAARKAYERSLALDPTDAISRQNLAALDSAWNPTRAAHGFADALAMDPTLKVARVNLDRSVGWAALRVLAVWYLAARVVFASDTSLARLVAYACVVVPFTLWTYARLPAGVKTSLGTILAPGASTNRIALGMIVAGVVAVAGTLIGDARSHGDDVLLDLGFVGGFLLFGAGCIGVAVTIRDHRRQRHS